jgi:hypothetical protein
MDKHLAMFGPNGGSTRDDFTSPIIVGTVIFLALFAA